jgi:hypothetical protein
VIGFTRKGDKFILKIGVGEYVVAADQLADELKAFFGGASNSGRAGPVPVIMPKKEELRRASDGTYRKYIDYVDEVRGRELHTAWVGAGKQKQFYKTRWPMLPEPLYDEMIRHFRRSDMTRNGTIPLYL